MKQERPREAVAQNLKDARCDDAQIERFLALLEDGKKGDDLSLLSKHRRVLLDCCHAQQKKIDCLDYLVCRMEHEI